MLNLKATYLLTYLPGAKRLRGEASINRSEAVDICHEERCQGVVEQLTTAG